MATIKFNYTANNLFAYYSTNKEGFLVSGELDGNDCPYLGPFSLQLYYSTISDLFEKITSDTSSKKPSNDEVVLMLYAENNITEESFKNSNLPICLTYTIRDSNNSIVGSGKTYYSDSDGQYVGFLTLSNYALDNTIEISLDINEINVNNIDIFDEDNHTSFDVLLKPALISYESYATGMKVPTKLSSTNILKDITDIKTSLNTKYVPILTLDELERFGMEMINGSNGKVRSTGGYLKVATTTPINFQYHLVPACPEKWLNNSDANPYNLGWWEYVDSNNYYLSMDSHNDLVTYYNENSHFKDYFIPLWVYPDEIYAYIYDRVLGFYRFFPLDDNVHKITPPTSSGHIIINRNIIPAPTELLATYLSKSNSYPTFKFILSSSTKNMDGSYIFSMPVKTFGTSTTIESIIGRLVNTLGEGDFQTLVKRLDVMGLSITNNSKTLVLTPDTEYDSNHTYYINQPIQYGIIYQANTYFFSLLSEDFPRGEVILSPYSAQTIKQSMSQFEMINNYIRNANPLSEELPLEYSYTLEQKNINDPFKSTQTIAAPTSVKQIKTLAELLALFNSHGDPEEPFIWTGQNNYFQWANIIWTGEDTSDLEGVNPSEEGWFEMQEDGMSFILTTDTTFNTDKDYVVLKGPVDTLITGNVYTFYRSEEHLFEIDANLSEKNIFYCGSVVNMTYDTLRYHYSDIFNDGKLIPIDANFIDGLSQSLPYMSNILANKNTTPGTYILKSTITEVVDDDTTTPPTTHLETTYNWVLETT